MQITLSRRNLLSLLAKLEIQGSRRTIVKSGGVSITAETDEVVYAGRIPGPMDPQTEALMSEMEEALRPIQEASMNRPPMCAPSIDKEI